MDLSAPLPFHAAKLGDPCANETALLHRLRQEVALDESARGQVRNAARELIEAARSRSGTGFLALDALLREYPMAEAEGVALLRMAEALLRVSDAANADSLIADCLQRGNWIAHVGRGRTLLGNLSGAALGIGKRLAPHRDRAVAGTRVGAAAVRHATLRAMHLVAGQFVFGETIQTALARAAKRRGRYSFDMLGEGARTVADAERYFAAYAEAIEVIGGSGRDARAERHGISIKLSALHPRYEESQRARVWRELLPRLAALADRAQKYGIGLTIDAEESERLELSLDLFDALVREPRRATWAGCGLAVQAYQHRASAVIDWIIEAARAHGRRCTVRLVKGAYWDAEIKRAQELGLAGYSVFTRKHATDVCYLACAKRLLAERARIYPQFATHNPMTIAAVMALAGDAAGFEFQRLHGMGEGIYRGLAAHRDGRAIPCRVYAPVGRHRDLLAYLVRRLLENGANSSFVNQLADTRLPVEALLVDPLDAIREPAASTSDIESIPLPMNLYAPTRTNSTGIDLAHPDALRALLEEIRTAPRDWSAASLVAGAPLQGAAVAVRNPANHSEVVGAFVPADSDVVPQAMTAARRGFAQWSAQPVEERARVLDRAADLFERHRGELIALLAREAGKTLADAVADLREAVDFCRYYAAEARRLFAQPTKLPGATGESNELSFAGRGVFVCISPWNFPLAIFTGQVAAALVAGNAVIAKPAEQTPLIAYRAIQLMLEAGAPSDALQLLLGDGATVGQALVSHPEVAGVAFTGSTETARIINRTLAARDAPIVPLIAETGGQNAMIVDSTALPEQVVDAVLTSAFRSAGQRCSALRVLYLQEEIADEVLEMLAGAARELRLGDPLDPATDVGPVIDADAHTRLTAHAERMAREAKLLFKVDDGAMTATGYFFGPRAFAVSRIGEIGGEVFGPILHVIRYRAAEVDRLIDEINGTGFGLTFGIHTRIDARADYVRRRIRAGNVYVNRSMIGAVVGSQPFGGEGLSGTGPKAGGPNYLARFAAERTYTVNTAAIGGNVALLAATTDRRAPG